MDFFNAYHLIVGKIEVVQKGRIDARDHAIVRERHEVARRIVVNGLPIGAIVNWLLDESRIKIPE